MSNHSKLILGTVQFGLDYGINNQNGKPNQNVVNDILDKAFENGIQLLDTAEAYGNSQEVIGNYHKNSENRFKIITKYSLLRTDLPNNIRQRVQSDIDTLSVESLYCYMFHSYSDFKENYFNFEKAIAELKEEGKIEKLGVSVYSNEELEDLLNYSQVDVVQLPFNLLDNCLQRKNSIEKAKLNGIEIHTRSVFLQGLFFKNTNELSVKLKPLKNHLNFINDEAKVNDLQIGSLALGYVCHQEMIDNVLVGVDSVEQLEENIKSLDVNISTQLIEKMNSIEVEERLLLNPSNWD